MEANENTNVRAEQVRSGRVLINQIDGNISIYDADGKLVVKHGSFIDPVTKQNLYGTEIYDDTGKVINRVGYLGLDSSGNPVYGFGTYDVNGVLQGLLGKHTSGF